MHHEINMHLIGNIQSLLGHLRYLCLSEQSLCLWLQNACCCIMSKSTKPSNANLSSSWPPVCIGLRTLCFQNHMQLKYIYASRELHQHLERTGGARQCKRCACVPPLTWFHKYYNSQCHEGPTIPGLAVQPFTWILTVIVWRPLPCNVVVIHSIWQ